ncbi:MAG TPA: carbohydrate kinase [Flavisolibacter sp.]
MENNIDAKVVCFGEVLWDILPSGPVPGGAPMNVAYHLHKQGLEPQLITSIGNDKEGDELRSLFESHGVSTRLFQSNGHHETGKVYAHPNEQNEVAYEIVQPVAWDFIEWRPELKELVAQARYFVFGSLAARSEVSRNTLFSLLENAPYGVVDINLRPPHYNRRLVEQLLHKASFLKLNEAELDLISAWSSKLINTEDKVRALADVFDLSTIVVTMGEKGALLFMDGTVYRHGGFKVRVADTVGSGDAFLAGLLSKLNAGTQPAPALEYANALGALIATKIGACPDYTAEEINAVIKSG